MVVDLEAVRDALGRQKVFHEAALRTAVPGVATGLSVTGAGGDVLFIEATSMRGKEGLVLTGQLGDVMKESARIALSYVRGHAAELGIDEDAFVDREFHVHVPAGAIPKDGPSAGITMTTALASLLSGRPIKHTVGMTGEVTLQGRVLPIGGLKQKVLAAHAAGLTEVIIPERNRGDLDDVPADVREAMTFHPVMDIGEVLEQALEAARGGGGMTGFAEKIEREVTSWEGVTKRRGKFGTTEFRLGRYVLGAAAARRPRRRAHDHPAHARRVRARAGRPGPWRRGHRLTRRVLRLFRPYRGRLGTVLVLIVVSAGLGVVSPFLLRDVLDVAIPENDDGLLIALVAGMIGISIATGVLGVGQTWLSNVVGQRVMHDLRAQVYRHLQRLSLAFFTRTRTGEIQSRIANDIGGVQTVVTNTATSIVSNVTTVVATVVAMFLLDWRLAVFSLALTPVLRADRPPRRQPAQAHHGHQAGRDGRHLLARAGVAQRLGHPARQVDGPQRRAGRPLRARVRRASPTWRSARAWPAAG